MSRALFLALSILALASLVSATNYTVSWNVEAVATQCRTLAASSNFTWNAPNQTVFLMYQATDANGGSPGALGGTWARVNNSDGSAEYNAMWAENLNFSRMNFTGCCAYDGFANGGPKYSCSPGSVFDVEPESVALGAASSSVAPATSTAAPATSTVAPASTSAAPTTSAASTSTTTTSRPAAAGRIGGSVGDKILALAGAVAVVAAVGA